MSKLPTHVSVALRSHDGKLWGALQQHGHSHEICAEVFKLKEENYTFIAGHRVRRYKVSGNVNWRCLDALSFGPQDATIDISAVSVQKAPRRQQGRR